jgi:murein DD-endopeptidase MepM/ murein hydrolase activator NlpD
VCAREASTYSGHFPDADSIDLGEWTAQDANMGKGQPVVASADGTVLDVFFGPGGDTRVYLDHGAGWVTHYLHLEQVPPLAIGQQVAQGEQIGRVGNTGTVADHLHFTQLADGNAVQIAFNGTLITTQAGNAASYGTWGNGEKLTSANCPMDAFVNVDQVGIRSRLLYKPGSGAVKIVAFNSSGTGITTLWSATG